MKKARHSATAPKSLAPRPRCGLCGSTRKRLTRTPCCGNLICDDEDEYVLFSYARNSCHRNHSRYTLCSYHYNEGHPGRWQGCKKCRRSFETEMYVWFGTNEYNFEKLENPPSFEPTRCVDCRRIIHLADDGFSISPAGEYRCDHCAAKEWRRTEATERKSREK